MPATLLDKLTAQVGFIGLGLMGSRSRGAWNQSDGAFELGTAVQSLRIPERFRLNGNRVANNTGVAAT